ncbi:2794_t:CDS:2, partial [Paraglomus occultum]
MPPKRKLPSTIKESAATAADFTTSLQTPSERQKTMSMGKLAIPLGKQNTSKLRITSEWSPTSASSFPPSSITTFISGLSSYGFSNENCLMWFRSDLRLQDNPALSTASRIAHANSKFLFALYIISPQDWQLHDTAAIKVNFIMRNLKILKEKLAALNIPLVVETVEERKNIARTLTDICRIINVNHVFANIEYEVDEQQRDKECQSECETHNIKLEFFHDQCVTIPGSIVSK